MHNLLRCRRGTAAFVFVAALVPLIGVVALGGEAGSWYVTKKHAQNAADSAAIAGGWSLVCSINANRGVPCTDTNSADYRARQFAAKYEFCDGGDPPSYYPWFNVCKQPTGTSRSVSVAVGTDQVTVTVKVQQQPAHLAGVLLGKSTVNIGATAVARVQIWTNPCILALEGSASFQGSATVSSPNCGIASNSTASNSFDFTGNGGLNINAPSFARGGCSQTGGNQCDNVTTNAAKVPNPLSGLDSAMASLTTSVSNFPGGKCVLPQSYETYQCYYDKDPNISGGTTILNGTYFFSAGLTIGGNAIVKGTATLVFLGSASRLTISGSPTIQLTAPKDHLQLPSPLSSVSSLMTDLLIYDPESPKNKNDVVKVTGGSDGFFNGTVYVPNSPVEYSGNTSASTPDPGCFQVIAYAVTFSGNTKLDETKCKSDGAGTPEVLRPSLVQ